MTRQAVIYRRVSSKRQSDEGQSLDDQDAELVAWCKAQRWEVIGNFSDSVSGRREKTEKRVGFQKAIDLACAKRATLVVADLDRFGRSQSVGMANVERLQDAGAGVIIKSLGVDSDTIAGKMMIGFMFAMAEWASGNIGKGVKRANDATVKRLKYRSQGVQPYGYTFEDGVRTPVPAQQAVIARIQAYPPRVSCAAICDALNAELIPARRGGLWKPGVVWRLRTAKGPGRARSCGMGRESEN